LLAGLADGVGTMCAWQQLRVRQPLVERTELAFEERIIELTTSIPGIEHHERAVFADRIEQLRNGRHELGMVITVLVFNAQHAVAFLGTLLLLGRLSPWLLLLPLSAVPSLWAGSRNNRIWHRVEDRTAEPSRVARHLYELCTTAAPGAEVRTFGIGPELRRRRQVVLGTVLRERARARLMTSGLDAAAAGCSSLAWVLAVSFVARRAVHGDATPGDVVLCISLAGDVRQYIGAIASLRGWLLGCLRTVARFRWLEGYAAAATRAAPAIAAPVPDRLTDGITLHGVSFAYGDGEPVLRDVDLVLPAGSTVAVVGENGAGKTTLVKLLCRFYEPTSGSIDVDGTSLAAIDPEAWRSRTSAVFQDHLHLELTAGESVGVGDLSRLADETAIRAALERAGAGGLEHDLRDGLDTMLGRSSDNGIELSGGQWQKLALGRGCMREAPLLLVLDEPTSALDPSAEHALFERFGGAARRAAVSTGAITVLVSHRFSTVRMADLIVVVDDGRIRETGSHADLVAAGGLYAELFELQARTYR
jgi:ATP-binding cassette subfamily B protein